MSLILKATLAVGLAASAVWSASLVPVTAPPPAPEAWAEALAPARAVADTLALDLALGQLVAAPADAPGLDALVAAGRVGRVEAGAAGLEAHLRRVRAWHDASPIAVAVGTDAGLSGLGGAPPLATPLQLGAAGRPDLAFMAGKALAEASLALGVQSPGASIVLAAGASPYGAAPGGAVERSLVRGVRAGGALPSAVVPDASAVEALDVLAEAGLMEARVAASGSVDLVEAVAERAAFTGLVVADLGSQPRGAVEALRAGADVVATRAPAAVYDSLARAVRTGRLSEVAVRTAARRVLAAKAWAGLDLIPNRPVLAAEGSARPVRISAVRAPSAEFVRRADLLAREVARRSMTVLQGESGPLPLVGPGAEDVFSIVLDPGADPDRGLPFVNALSDALAPDRTASYARLGLGDVEARYGDALAAAREADYVVLAVFPDSDGRLAPRYQAFVRALNDRRPVVLVLFGDPALAVGVRRPEAIVEAYEATEPAQVAAAQAIAGQADVTGTLPFGVAGLARAGAGSRLRQQALRPGTPEEAGLDAATAARVDAVMERAVASGAFPGGAIAVGRDGVLLRLRGYGRLGSGGPAATPETAYDLASLTKVVGTTATAMQLVEEGRLDLDREVVEYLPRYRGMGKEYVTVRQLLAHTAGHRPWWPFYARGQTTKRAALDFVYADTLQYPPGTRSRYSDFDMIVLGEVIEAVTREPLEDAFEERVFAPLGMRGTGFRPVGARDPSAAPTETDRVWRGRTLQGEVHDEAASVMGGVAGHAGLFSTAADLARFGFLLANGGEAYGARLFRRTTIDQFTERVRLRSTYPTGLGWMVNHGETSAGRHFGPRAFGHTGFTGTSIWVDPDQRMFVVLLTNRVHPSRRNTRIRDVRPALADAVAGAVVAPPGEPATAWGFGPVPDDLPRVAAN